MSFDYNIEKQHKKGKLHAIERIRLILDKNSFYEIGGKITNYKRDNKIPYDGVITGYGCIAGKPVYIYSQDFTVCGGTLGLMHGKKIAHVIDMAIRQRCPVIGINDSGGARIQEGVNSLAGYGEVFYYNTLASGYIPQISIIAGACAGGAVYSPGITDFVFVIDKISQMFVTGPGVVKSVIGEECSAEELGGAKVHAAASGAAHFFHDTEEECYEDVRRLIEILPDSWEEDNPCTRNYPGFNQWKNGSLNDSKDVKNTGANTVMDQSKACEIEQIIPRESKKVYDVKKVIRELVDEESFLEVHERFAQNIVVGFGKIGGITVGLAANQPKYLGGVLDCDSSDKGARFIRFCDCFNIPIITLVDVPGFMPGLKQEHDGIIRHGAKLLYAYAEATTVKLTVIMRKAYGGAYIAMSSKHLRADMVYSWPLAEAAVMGAESAISILYKNDMKQMETEERAQFRQEKIREYEKKYINGDMALEEGYIDACISPMETRERLYQDILYLKGKKDKRNINKKHGNIPL